MCEHCEKAQAGYGVGSQLSLVVRDWMHPPTAEQIAEYNRAVADLVDYLNACDERRDD